ncbi:MAG: IS66 family insertion sequence element accessory protein TnpB [Myxococcales bacterium]|nr:IS66 family insertion sequence element accessory protein TnpB [Myxococcales bacterium]
MIPTPRRILIARDPVDIRKGIAGLAAVCEVHLGEEPLDGTLFVFSNRSRKGLRMLIWTHGGFLMLYKKLEKGRFRWPPLEADRGTVTPAELAALMEGLPPRRWASSRWFSCSVSSMSYGPGPDAMGTSCTRSFVRHHRTNPLNRQSSSSAYLRPDPLAPGAPTTVPQLVQTLGWSRPTARRVPRSRCGPGRVPLP